MSISELIEAHRAAVMADEANFTDDFEPIDAEAADASHGLEIAAYQAFIAAPCLSADDVQRKLAYLMDGTLGVRTPLISCLEEVCYLPDDVEYSMLPLFLRSLQIEARA